MTGCYQEDGKTRFKKIVRLKQKGSFSELLFIRCIENLCQLYYLIRFV